MEYIRMECKIERRIKIFIFLFVVKIKHKIDEDG